MLFPWPPPPKLRLYKTNHVLGGMAGWKMIPYYELGGWRGGGHDRFFYISPDNNAFEGSLTDF